MGSVGETARKGGRNMEVQPGVFVTGVSTDEWEPDPEAPGTEMHQLVDADGVSAGMSRFTWHITTPFKEMWVLASG